MRNHPLFHFVMLAISPPKRRDAAVCEGALGCDSDVLADWAISR